MAILNYTTKIDSMKTIMEINKILSEHGAFAVMTEFNSDNNPDRLTFMINVNGNIVNYRLPCNIRGIKKVLTEDKRVPKTLKTDEQALRVSWRIIKNWIEAQMALIESEQATLSEIFLPYAVAKDGRTLFQHFENNTFKLLEQ